MRIRNRRWPGYRGDDALLSVRVTCINCGLDSHEVGATPLADLNDFIDFTTFVACERCGEETRAITYIYEGRKPYAPAD